jgi:sugar-specific transcriptional regulator TrmB
MNDSIQIIEKQLSPLIALKLGLVTYVGRLCYQDVGRLGDETIRKVLRAFGATEKETEVYIFLAKHGALRSIEISKGIKAHKAEVYRILKSLQTKGLVESTLQFPTRFVAVSFEKVLDSFLKAKREEVDSIEKSKENLLKDWKNINKTELAPPVEKFVVLEGNKIIYARISQMIRDTKTQLSSITTVSGLMRADQFGLFDAAFHHPLRAKIQFRFIIDLSSQNLNAVKTLLKRKMKARFNFKGRIPDLHLQSPRMVIKDEEEILFFIAPITGTSPLEQDDVCLWTNCKSLVQAFNGVFEDSWRNSTDIQKKIVEIETGKPTPEICVIKDAEVAYKKYVDTMQLAEKEIIMMTSSEGLIRSWKNTPLLKELAERGVSVRIMAPVVKENLQAAQELSRYCAFRHVPVGYIETTIVDGKHLFQFEKQPADEGKPQVMPCFENVLYSNDLEYVEETKNMLKDIWRNAVAPSAITLDSITKPLMPAVAPLSDNEFAVARADSPYKKISHGAEEKPGVVTEKEVLNKIINAKKYPGKNWPKDIMRYYGSSAMAVIHPPDYFNLPEMMIWVLHYDKQSSFGAEDLLLVFLWLETPEGHAYVPVAFVTDNPRAVEFWKAAYAGTPAGQNCQLIKKDDFQVRVHSNIFFAAWTVPIPLLPQSYILPPSCILFEGYSKVKPGLFEYGLPSGVKVSVEFNGIDAFVTFFHPSSKYSGPGTDGALGRDIVTTIYPPRYQPKVTGSHQ